MNSNYKDIYFTTLAIDGFINVFSDFPETNFIILDSFNNLVEREIVKIYAFVIMRNHIHIVWQKIGKEKIGHVITSFKKFTGREVANYINDTNSEYLSHFISVRKDRKYKIWKLTKGNILIHSLKMLGVKIRYIHKNPTKGEYKTVGDCTNFYFSSAKAYAKQSSNFRFLTVLKEVVLWC